MKKTTLICVSVYACVFLAHAQTNLPVITVTASAQTVENAAIDEVLRAEPGVVLNSQGGSQNDLSVRGSSFSGAGLSLGGLTLRNPQTEQFHAELALPATMLSRPSISTGLDNQGGHLVGTVGFDILPLSGKKQVEIGMETDARDSQSLLVQHLLSNTLGLGVFAGRESASGVDHPDNDYDRESIGGHLQFHEKDTQIDLIISGQKKEFGARGYYGVNDALPATETTEDMLVFLSATQGNLSGVYRRAGISWHEFNDDYRLPTLAYRNRHRSRISSAFFEGRTEERNGWALGWRGDLEEERIASTGSGPLGHFHRTRGGLSLLPRWRNHRWKFTIGARGEFFTEESAEFLPQLGADFLLADNLSVFAAYSESVRLPSYTELNYNSVGSLGNAGLNPQTSEHFELGFKGIPADTLDWKVSAFHRRSANTIDWIKTHPVARWTAANLGELQTSGVEAQIGWCPAQNIEMQLTYTWIYKIRKHTTLRVLRGHPGTLPAMHSTIRSTLPRPPCCGARLMPWKSELSKRSVCRPKIRCETAATSELTAPSWCVTHPNEWSTPPSPC